MDDSKVSTELGAEISKLQPPQAKPLRAIIEIMGRELKVVPIADSDADEQRILDALRFIIEYRDQR